MIVTRAAFYASVKYLLLLAIIMIAQSGSSQLTEQTVIEDNNIHLSLEVRDTASLADTCWIKIRLTNKSGLPMYIESLDYKINVFEALADGSSKLLEGHLGSGNKYNLIHWFHDQKNLLQAEKRFKIEPGQTISCWKHTSNKAAIRTEEETRVSEEICALLQLNIKYELKGIPEVILENEVPFCTYWIKLAETDKDKLAERMLFSIRDVHMQKLHTSVLALLMELKALRQMIDSNHIAQGIIDRSWDKHNSERMILIRILQQKNELAHPLLFEHYKQCIGDDACQWKADFELYWDNRLIPELMASKMYINKKASLLEVHSSKWANSDSIKDQVFNILQDEYKINFDTPVNADNFEEWYKKIKHLCTSRHPSLIDYLKALLENENFYTVTDRSGVDPRNPKESQIKIRYFRVCDVAYVCLLRIFDEITVRNTFFENRLKSEVYIDKRWEGRNDANQGGIKLINPYTTLLPNLRMAEKYYYLDSDNKVLLKEKIEQYEKGTNN